MDAAELLRWGIAHDPCREGDRFPVGAVPVGHDVRVVLRVRSAARALVDSVELLVLEGESAGAGVRMDECPEGFAGTVSPSRDPHVVLYAFRIVLANESLLYYVPRADGRSTAGEVACPGVDGEWGDGGWEYFDHRLEDRPAGAFGLAEPLPGFQVTVYEPWFETPDWLSGAVMYQIFPDRFARGEGGLRYGGLAYHHGMGRPVRLHESWDEPVEWKGDVPEGEIEPQCPGDDAAGDMEAAEVEGTSDVDADTALLAAQMKAYDPVDFYGGTLAGIREKIPYLASLGVEVLYLNPVFEARSNHRYDTADYERIDPLLGDRDDFDQLVAAAAEQGISIVLDAVLSHTGDDSRYFNAKGSYREPGAMQGPESPFYGWYDFTKQADGAPYKSWWGHLSLPEVDERDASWQRYILGEGETDGSRRGGVLGSWLAAGVRGYRLDVADEIPDDVLERIRTCVKSVKPDAAVIGEVWEDPTTKRSYGVPRTYALGRSLDSVMNYPLRDALIGFALGRLDAHQLAAFLKSQQANYPGPMHACLMNLLSTHDVERVRSVLALQGPLKQLKRDAQLALGAGLTPCQDARAACQQRMIASLMYALPGTPCIYYGDERGLQGGGDPFCRATFPWDNAGRSDRGEDLTEFYRRIGCLRKGSQALRRGIMACTAPNADAVCVLRVAADGTRSFAVANRSDEPCRVVFDAMAPDAGLPDWAVSVLRDQDGPLRVAFDGCSGVHDDSIAEGSSKAGLVSMRVPACSTAFFD